MKHLRRELWFQSSHRRDYINITEQVESLVHASGVQNGLCLVNAIPITASVYIHDPQAGPLAGPGQRSHPGSPKRDEMHVGGAAPLPGIRQGRRA